MEVFQLGLYIIGAVVVSSFLSRFLPKISMPLVQIALGVMLAYLPSTDHVHLDPGLFMVLFIAPLLYIEAHDIDKPALLRTLNLSMSLAVGLVVATIAAVGFTLHAIWPAMTVPAACALGAALGPTDAVAVSSLGKEASLTERQRSVLNAESLFNDASGVVGFQFAILASVTGTFSPVDATTRFAATFIGGALFGVIVGWLANWLFETIRSLGWETTTTRVLMELFLPFMLYLAAENLIGVSGILAVVAAGLIVRFDRTGVGPNVARTNIVSSSVWQVLSFTLNGAVFILLGLLLPGAMSASWHDPHISNTMLISDILVISAVVIAMRFLWVTGMLRLARDQHTHQRRRMTRERWRSALVMTFGGPKGTITLALMLTIPYAIDSGHEFPMRDELIFVASGVIIVTLILANFLLPLIAPRHHDDDAATMDAITIEVLRTTIEELASRITEDNRRAVLMVMDSYTKRIARLQQRIGQTDPYGLEQLQIDALHWEKDYIKEYRDRLKAHPTPDATQQQVQLEACERLLDHIMNTLRHASGSKRSGHTVSQVRGRCRAFQRRAGVMLRRVSDKIRRTAPLLSESDVYAAVRDVQLAANEHVIAQLHNELSGTTYNTEHCSALLLDYRRADAVLRARPTAGGSAKAMVQAEEVKRESYAIELGVVRDMVEAGDITRAQARTLRRNIYVMSVDADASL